MGVGDCGGVVFCTSFELGKLKLIRCRSWSLTAHQFSERAARGRTKYGSYRVPFPDLPHFTWRDPVPKAHCNNTSSRLGAREGEMQRAPHTLLEAACSAPNGGQEKRPREPHHRADSLRWALAIAPQEGQTDWFRKTLNK